MAAAVCPSHRPRATRALDCRAQYNGRGQYTGQDEVDKPARIDPRRLGICLLVLACSSIGGVDRLGIAAPIGAPTAAAAPAVSPAGREVPMTVAVVPRSKSRGLGDTALVYLDGRIDADAPRRLTEALAGVDGKIAVGLNSPGGNLFAGMQLGRIVRARGASTHIIDHRTLRAGTCYSACAMTFLGGVHRFNDNGGRYGVHRASLLVGPAGQLDLGPELSSAIGSYIREMGVDSRLLDLCMKAGRDEMYVLSPREARDLGVVNDGRQPPEWSISAFPGGSLLQGRQTTADGTGTMFFSCDGTQTVFGSVSALAGEKEPIAAPEPRHLLTIGRHEAIPLKALGVSHRDGSVRSTFILPPNLVRLAMSARQIGYQMKPSSNRPPAIDYRVDIDGRAAPVVKKFLGDCLRGRAR